MTVPEALERTGEEPKESYFWYEGPGEIVVPDLTHDEIWARARSVARRLMDAADAAEEAEARGQQQTT